MTTLAQKMRTDVADVFLNLDHFAERFTYVSKVEGAKPIKAIKREHGGGPQKHQHAKSEDRRATFHIAQSLTDGVQSPAEYDQIIDDTASPRTTWTLVPSNANKLAAGLWSLEFASGMVTKIGLQQMSGL